MPAKAGHQRHHFRLDPSAITSLMMVALFLIPVLAGLTSVIGSAFNYLPALGFHTFALNPWRALLTTAGLPHMLMLTQYAGKSIF